MVVPQSYILIDFGCIVVSVPKFVRRHGPRLRDRLQKIPKSILMGIKSLLILRKCSCGIIIMAEIRGTLIMVPSCISVEDFVL